MMLKVNDGIEIYNFFPIISISRLLLASIRYLNIVA